MLFTKIGATIALLLVLGTFTAYLFDDEKYERYSETMKARLVTGMCIILAFIDVTITGILFIWGF